MEAEDYASLKIQLPGPLELLERRSQLDTRKILADFAAV